MVNRVYRLNRTNKKMINPLHDSKKLVTLHAALKELKNEYPHLTYSIVYKTIKKSKKPPFPYRRSSPSKKAFYLVNPKDLQAWAETF
jgi:hypothetical protein